MSNKKEYVIRYRHIPVHEMMTPKIYLPMQQTRLDVSAPYGKEQVLDALMEFFEGDDSMRREDIYDLEFFLA